MSNDDLKRMIGAHAALAFLLLPGLCALPLLALISPAPARYVFFGVWALLALALAALVVRLALRLRRAAESERRRASAETTPDLLS
jgi:hypothetical protein